MPRDGPLSFSGIVVVIVVVVVVVAAEAIRVVAYAFWSLCLFTIASEVIRVCFSISLSLSLSRALSLLRKKKGDFFPRELVWGRQAP